MKKRILSLMVSLLVLVMVIVGVTACSSVLSSNNKGDAQTVDEDVDETNLLQIIKSDVKLTQEQVMSQIKAEYLKTNKGYQADDQIVLVVNCQEPSLLEIYNKDAYKRYKTVAEFISSDEGKYADKRIREEQNSVLAYLEQMNVVTDVIYSYTAITNGIAIQTAYKNLTDIEGLGCVTSAIMSETYNQPEVKASSSNDASAIRNLVEIYETGIFDSSSVDYDGRGTIVAVLDNGFDLSHTVFQNDPPEIVLDMHQVSVIMTEPNFLATQLTKNLEVYNVYYSRKIPYKYDYADKDYDVNPASEEHGTHVAGIIGGKDDVITGVAVNTQLALMKVFPDVDDGGKTEDIMAALNDAVILGVDCINMSLGSSCGFTREVDKDEVNEIYDRIGEAGISLITAASNDYSSGFGGEQGNTNMVTNPDSGTVGSPSTYESALSVASISGTMSRFMIGNGEQTFFFKESNAITGKENNFYKELYEQQNLDTNKEYTFEYVTVPGVGLKVNFKDLDLKGKIALVKRGTTTFEEKAMLAKNAGAIACIIYNNIDGDILMSMGKTDHVPTISISKSDGTMLAKKSTGTITVSMSYQAGPFMSDFSSWGPTPSLELKPEITGHGGNIKSSVHGGGYDELSGTSMSTPNLTGLVVLIRQYLKEKYTEYSAKEISNLTNSLLMSTATIIMNEEGNPYSPRKQGAGLASLKNTVNTKAYLTVDDKDRPKLELGDDKERSGVYVMDFNIVNLSDVDLHYNIDLVGMTETVSSSDEKHVAETPYILSKNFSIKVNNVDWTDTAITVPANLMRKVTITYSLTDDDKAYIDNLFPYGMYVEGFVKVVATDEGEVSLNMPFLAFYGDWTQPPMFDKTYYEVETTAHDGAVDDEDKIKADYFATTPYGSYFYNYIIPLGTYIYDIDESAYDAIPAVEEHIAVSDTLGCLDGIGAVYAGMLRGAKQVIFTVTDKLTGEVIKEETDYNGIKAHSNGGSPVPYYNMLKMKSYEMGLINNRIYEFKMVALCDYGDGGLTTNVRNTFSFDFAFDNEAPVLKEVSYEKVYDKTQKKDRYYMYLTIYDNHYVMSITPVLFTSSSTYTTLTKDPIPVYSQKGTNNVVKIEVTDYLEDIFADALIPSALAFSIDDYALNSNIFICQLPGTRGDFKFTKNGEMDGTDYIILSMYEDEIVDLTQYLATADKTVDSDKSYLKNLVWESSNEKVVEVKEGMLVGINSGRATITVLEKMNLKQAIIIINVKQRKADEDKALRGEDEKKPNVDNINDVSLKELRFAYFKTLFAYSRAAQTSEIGQTGSSMFISSTGNLVSFYPGEKIQLYYDVEPWYAYKNYEFTFESTNPNVATVDQDGVVTGLKEGSTTITLKSPSSNIMARLRISIKNPFVIENRSLIAYKGLGGEVIIPDDEGILYIGSFSFCLYETDYSIELPEDDYDSNKIPSANTSITSVVIPAGIEKIEKYAFYNCSGLRSVTLASDCKQIFHYAFYGDDKLESINLENVDFVGNYAFYGCTSLNNINTPKLFAIGERAFEGCTSLESINLTALRNTGSSAFKDCSKLSNVQMSQDTKLSEAMFVRSGLTSVTILNNNITIPSFCFAQCDDLTSVVIENNIYEIEEGAFCQCPKLKSVTFNGKVDIISSQVFYDCKALTSIKLPNSEVDLGEWVFNQCENLEELQFGKDTVITNILAANFEDTNLSRFVVDAANPIYAVSQDKTMLLSKDGKVIILVAVAADLGDYVLNENIEVVNNAAFSGCKLTSLTITNPNVEIRAEAFANCKQLTKVVLPADVSENPEFAFCIGDYAFGGTEKLEVVENLDKVNYIGAYAFGQSGIKSAVIGADAVCAEGAFYMSKIEEVTIGEYAMFDNFTFMDCKNLKTVNMPENGGVYFGAYCFAGNSALEIIDLSKVGDQEYGGVIEEATFFKCTSLKVANLPNIVAIGRYAFADCENLKYVSMPIVQEIQEGAFSKYEGTAPTFMEIELPNTLQVLGEGVFVSCNGLTTITIPASIDKIDNFMFSLCTNLETVNLPETVKSIGDYAFLGCEKLTDINLEKVEEIGEYAFRGVNVNAQVNLTVDLTSVKVIKEGAFAEATLVGDYVCNDLEEVGVMAFLGCRMTSFVAPKLSVIEEGAFQDCTALTSFTFSDKLSSIGSFAFQGTTKLANYYVGDKQTTGKINDYAFLDNGVLYTVIGEDMYELASIPTALNVKIYEVVDKTVRIDFYAGNDNTKIEKLVFPDSLRAIGNFAFMGYTNLKTVEFKSVQAPILECNYNSNAQLSESDPGYDLLHNQFDIFGLELCYYNFIDLVGKKKAIKMILPANKNITGYESVVYEAYFGTVESSQRSEYVAMEQSMIDFINYAKDIVKLDVYTIASEQLVNNALTALNTITQDPTTYGIDADLWATYVSKSKEAKLAVSRAKLVTATKQVQGIQAEIDNLEHFDLANIDYLASLAQKIKGLKGEDRSLLIMDNYNQVVAEYDAYVKEVAQDVAPIKSVATNLGKVLMNLLANTTLAGVALFMKKSLL